MASIRPATPQDAAAIAHVHIESWRATYAGIVSPPCLDSLNLSTRTLDWQHWLTLDLSIHVAELDHQVVGFIGGGPLREPLPNLDAELYTLYLLPHVQRQGLGSALLRTLGHSLLDRSFHSLAAWVLEDNSSTAFYTRTGALPVQSGQVDMGGDILPTVCYAWSSLQALAT